MFRPLAIALRPALPLVAAWLAAAGAAPAQSAFEYQELNTALQLAAQKGVILPVWACPVFDEKA